MEPITGEIDRLISEAERRRILNESSNKPKTLAAYGRLDSSGSLASVLSLQVQYFLVNRKLIFRIMLQLKEHLDDIFDRINVYIIA